MTIHIRETRSRFFSDMNIEETEDDGKIKRQPTKPLSHSWKLVLIKSKRKSERRPKKANCPIHGKRESIKITHRLIYGGKFIKNSRLKNTFVRITEKQNIYKSI